jgi:hypothetical protein
MARPKKLNDATSEIIQKNILEENPEGFPKAKEEALPIVKEIPKIERIVFRNDRDPGIPLEFHYSSKTIPLTQYKLFDGQEYDLPVEVIEHLEDRKIPISAYRKGMDGHPERFISGYKYNFSLKPIRKAS